MISNAPGCILPLDLVVGNVCVLGSVAATAIASIIVSILYFWFFSGIRLAVGLIPHSETWIERTEIDQARRTLFQVFQQVHPQELYHGVRLGLVSLIGLRYFKRRFHEDEIAEILCNLCAGDHTRTPLFEDPRISNEYTELSETPEVRVRQVSEIEFVLLNGIANSWSVDVRSASAIVDEAFETASELRALGK